MRRLIPRIAVALALTTTLASCRSTTEPDDLFSAARSDMSIRLFNRSSVTVFYMMIDPDMLPLADYIPCTSRAIGCPSVAPHSNVDVPRTEIRGDRADLNEALVIYWMVREGITPDRVVGGGTVRVPLN